MTDTQNFKTALNKFTLPWEGGKVDDPTDPGGRTAYGVTQVVFNQYLKNKGQAPRDVFTINQGEIEDLYYKMFWVPGGCPNMPLPLAAAHFDTCVNFGVSGGNKARGIVSAAMLLQRALGAVDDGIFGLNTAKALAAKIASTGTTDLGVAYVNERIKQRHTRVAQVPSQSKYLKGWLNRDNALMTFVKGLK